MQKWKLYQCMDKQVMEQVTRMEMEKANTGVSGDRSWKQMESTRLLKLSTSKGMLQDYQQGT
jgi:hypothetical protein